MARYFVVLLRLRFPISDTDENAKKKAGAVARSGVGT